MWNTLSGSSKIRELELKHSDLAKSLILSYLPVESKFAYLMDSFRAVVEPYEDFNEITLDEVVRRSDIKHFKNWFEEEFNERLKNSPKING